MYAATRWDTVFSVRSTLTDSILLRPRLIAAGGGSVYVYDYGDQSVKAFDAGGRWRWQLGRRGEGPGEFLNPFDLDVGPDGVVWVLDVDAGRITRLGPDGSLLGVLRPASQIIVSLVPEEAHATVVSASLDPFWLSIDLEGNSLAEGGAPIERLDEIHPYARQALASGAARSAVWAAVFVRGDPLFVYEGRDLRCRSWLVEGGDFPSEPSREDAIWAVAVAVSDTSVFVLTRGLTEKRLQLIDVYSASECSYQYTHLLPRRMNAMAYADGVFYFEYEDPAPTLVGLRPRP
jgi:hypothetical protein